MMPDEAPIETTENQVPEQTGAPEAQGGETGVNPSWEGIRSKLTPEFFKLIEPELAKFDQQAKQRIESVNSRFGWAAELEKNGVSPDYVQKAVHVARTLDEQPEQVFQSLQTFLQQNGRLPSDQELKNQVNEDTGQGDDDENEDPRIAALEAQVQSVSQMLTAQQQAALQAQADAELNEQVMQLRQAHPEFDDADVQEIIRRAAFTALTNAQNGQDIPPLEEFAKDYVENVRNRILSAPRAGAQAPRLVPTSGGVPASNQPQISLGSLPNGKVQDIVAELLKNK